jgi:branched-chain amino acid aminotransferase
MTSVMDIQIEKIQRSKIRDTDFNNLAFGRHFTDHMLEVDYKNG